jgi:hypothetical protein
MKFDAIVHYRLAADALQVEAPRMIPYVAATLATKLAGDVRGGVQRAMPQVFDRPEDFTIRGVYTKGATKVDMTSEVYFPESQEEQGRAKREYIRPGARGAASRRQKKTEYLLTRIGALPPGWVTTPGKGAQLNEHGNLGGPVYRQIINVLQIRYNKPKPVSARSTKAASRLNVAALFFAVPPGANKLGKGGGWLPPGVWKHLPGGKITQILKFVKKASYQPRLDLKKIALEEVKRSIGARWRESIAVVAERFKRRDG